MKVYQCLHIYPPHIPQFEQRHGVNEDMDFATLHKLLLQDGYASVYILAPALEGRMDVVFFTLWDYGRLQRAWAREHGLKTTDLDQIKLAQIEEYKPDVFYNMSAFCDGDFIRKLSGRKDGRKDVYWNGIIECKPRTFAGYDGQLSLHRPHVEYWKSLGLAACELQPGIPDAWRELASDDRDIDVLFYGQYDRSSFSKRNSLVEQILHHKVESGRDIRCHLQCNEPRRSVFRIPGLPWAGFGVPSLPTVITEQSLPPLYGETLYRTIGRAKIVVNAYTDFNWDFKSNMRLFESVGLGAFLISEAGNYPEGLDAGIDFYAYSGADDLFGQIGRVLEAWDEHAQMARRTRAKISALYNKERQWNTFREFIASL